MNAFNRERKNLINSILNDDEYENEVEKDNEETTEVNHLQLHHILGDKIGTDDSKNMYISFVDVVSENRFIILAEALDRNPMLKLMKLMKLKNRERGSAVCKFNTLKGR